MSGRTLGLSIHVPSPFGEVVDAARSGYEPGHHRMPAHITLIAPFDADADIVEDVIEHCRGVAARHVPFTVVLAGTATFAPISPVVYLPVVEGASACAALAADLATGPLAFPARFPYHPHVTIAHTDDRDVLERALADFADTHASFVAGAIRVSEHVDAVWIPLVELPLADQRSE